VIWLVTHCEPGGAYETAHAIVVEAASADEAAEDGLGRLMIEASGETCDQCESAIASHLHVLPYDDVTSYDVRSMPVPRERAS
jgi:hypothetical protein